MAQEWLEVGRQRCSKTRRLYIDGQPTNKFSMEATIGPMHYKDAQGQFQEIQTDLVPSSQNIPGFGDVAFEMLRHEYELFVRKKIAGVAPLVRYRVKNTDYWVDFTADNLDWVNDAGDREHIKAPGNPDTTVSGNEAKWSGVYGAGIDLRYVAGLGRMEKWLDIASPLPAPTISNPSLEYSEILRFHDNLDVYVNGILWDKSTELGTVSEIEFRSPDGKLQFIFPVATGWREGEGESVQGEIRLKKSGNKLYVSARFPYSWLQVAGYPVHLDTTAGPQYGGTAGTESVSPEDDEDWLGWTADRLGSDNSVYGYITAATYDTNCISYRGKVQNFGFSIPAGATIDGIVVEIDRVTTSGSAVDYRVQLLDADGALVGDNKASGDTWPTSLPSQIKTYGSSTDTWGASPTPTMVNDVDFGLVVSVKATANDTDAYIDFIRATLYYTSVVAPTVTTQSPTNIQETTCTANGNITDTGGENCTTRGFKYGLTETDTWDVHEDGSFGAGAYDLPITGLSPGTTYFIRAYATNSAGTSYGAYVEFSTIKIYTYDGDIPLTALPSYISIFDRVYDGMLGLLLSPSSVSGLHREYEGSISISITPSSVASGPERSYAGALSLGILPSHVLIINYPYDGQLPITLTPAASYLQEGPWFMYAGQIGLALTPSHALIMDRLYDGQLPLGLLPSYASILDRLYSGAVSLSLSPSYEAMAEKGYDGAVSLSLLPSYLTTLEKGYDGQIPLSLLPSYVRVFEKPYDGALSLSLLPSSEVAGPERSYEGTTPLTLVPSYLATAEKGYGGVIPLALSPSHALIIGKVYLGAVALTLLPHSAYSQKVLMEVINLKSPITRSIDLRSKIS